MDDKRMQDKAMGVTQSRKGNLFNFESPAPGIHIYSNVWPNSLGWFEKLDGDEYWEENQIPGNIKWVREDYLDEATGKKSRTCWVWHDKEVQDNLEEVIDSYLMHWNLDPHSRESLRITRYEPAGEFFGMHSDDSFATPRTTSMVYYPNDDYEGGELEFLHFGLKIKPKAGQLFLFPAGYSYEHKIHPVTGGGYRRTMVSFFNQMTITEYSNRLSQLNPNEYYQPKLQYVLDKNFNG